MSEVDDEPAARSRMSRSVWPGLVWLIPLSALVLVLALGVRAYLNRGVDAVVSFDTAAGVKIGDTKVLYQGFEAGRVVKIDVAKDIRRVDVTIRLDHRAGAIMNDRTTFWLVGAKTNLGSMDSVKALFSGPAIGVAPGFGGKPTHRFRGLSEEPAVTPGTPGTPFVLTAEKLGSIKRGSSLNYGGQPIGKVTATALSGLHAFRVDIFVLKPFDALVRPGAVFSPAAPLQLSMGAGGIQAQVDDPSALLSGAITMDVPENASPTPSPAGARFILYASRQAADAGPPGPRVPYRMAFKGVGGDLAEGAPVTLLGFAVGEVTSRRLDFDPRTGLPFTRVTVGLEPARLHARASPGVTNPDALRPAADAALSRLLARGYRARLVQTPPLIGARSVELAPAPGARGAALVVAPGESPLIPAAPDSADLAAQASDILGKIDRVPIERIGRDVAAITGRVRSLVSSPKVDQSLDHLRNTLAQADRITADVQPQVGPLVAKLRQAADQATGAAAAARSLLDADANPDASLPRAIQELTDASGSIRALADYLGRHPEALLRGKGRKTP